jgi:hypothetical protein
MTKLRELYRMMNVTAITKTVLNHRSTMAVLNPSSMKQKIEMVHGQFKFNVCFAENIKPINKNGLSNAYVVLRVPEGTIEPPLEKLMTRSSPNTFSIRKGELESEPIVLTGNNCELFRSYPTYLDLVILKIRSIHLGTKLLQ